MVLGGMMKKAVKDSAYPTENVGDIVTENVMKMDGITLGEDIHRRKQEEKYIMAL